MKDTFEIRGNIVRIEDETYFKGVITVENGTITSIRAEEHTEEQFILPGFVDAHIHIESSMLVPSEFARLAVMHGTVGSVSDPHEIANVLGVAGVKFMIQNGKASPFKFHFGAPSCVPATSFETAGAEINSDEILELLKSDDIYYLAEMMNYPGVIYNDPEVHQKIKHAKDVGKPVDGHAPGLRGEQLDAYLSAGISTDHECFSYEEGLEKLEKGMHVIIREGSAAKNFDALIDLVPDYYEKMMFCSDDKHPDDLIENHIDELVRRGIRKGINVYHLLKMACINPVHHYSLPVGQLNEGDPADFIVVDNLTDLNIHATYINGYCVSEKGKSHLDSVPFLTPNNFETSEKIASDFHIKDTGGQINVIVAKDGELITESEQTVPKVENGHLVSDTRRDLLKIVMVNRYQGAPVSIGFIKNIGLKSGAIGSSVGHDSHNIIVVGVTDEAIATAVNEIIAVKGGICAVNEEEKAVLPLPVAGIMSDQDGWTTGKQYQTIDQKAKALGTTLRAPFMTLSFMGLLVIPALKLSDKGLFDGKEFCFIPLQENL